MVNDMKRKLLFIVMLMLIISAFSASVIAVLKKNGATNNPAQSDKDRLQIVASFYPVYLIGINLFDNVNEVEVKSLTELNTGCLHDYQLTTQDMKNISNADILVINGSGMEGFMDDIYENYPDLTVIDASRNIALYQDNPHVWLDPQLYIKQIENVKDAVIDYLVTNLTGNADAAWIRQAVENNAESYIAEVQKIDSELDDIRENYMEAKGSMGLSKAVIFHDSFAYIANCIGLPVAYSIPLDHDTALSAEDIADIINDVKKDNIAYLFTEEQYSDSVAKRIESETDAKVYIIDSAVTGDGTKSSYIDAMEKNIEVLKSALLK